MYLAAVDRTYFENEHRTTGMKIIKLPIRFCTIPET